MLKGVFGEWGSSRPVPRRGILRLIKAYICRDKLGELLVMGGHLSPQDLKTCLSLQKRDNRPLGEILIAQGAISAYQLKHVLWRQQVLRCVAAAVLCFATLTGFSKKSRADNIDDVPAKVMLASVKAGAQSYEELDHAPALFGTAEKHSENMKAFTKWIGMFKAFDKAMETADGKKVIEEMQGDLVAFQSDSLYKMADRVNNFMNEKRYILDQNNWGKSDYWATPIEFMQRGGDCEDFSIAKYVALRALGVPESRLRVAIVQDQKKNIPHAVLVVYTETGPVILDNQNKAVLSDHSISHYKPIYSINREGWWLHTASDETVLASARQ